MIVGGALSGAASALLLRRRLPECRILIVENADAFDQKVGEATVEVSATFLSQVLDLSDYLWRAHLPKHGLRFWFSDRDDRHLSEMTEVGPRAVPEQLTFQLDRAELDEHLLRLAADAGAEVARPAKAEAVEIGWPRSRVTLSGEGGEREVTCRWLIDASGRHSFLGRRLRLLERVESHPIAAMWGRWRGVANIDGQEITGQGGEPTLLPPIPASRFLATNHFCGYGYWCWLIPLRDGKTSIGVVYNKELVEWPDGWSLEDRYRRFLSSRPGLRDLLADAKLEPGDLRAYHHLPYRTSRYMDRGWALVSDAAGFLDPYYSPGLDHAAMSVTATAEIVGADLAGADDAEIEERIKEHNRSFLRSYEWWLQSLYIGKYETLGDAQLTAASYLLDTSFYFQFLLRPIRRRLSDIRIPAFGLDLWQAAACYRFIRFYNRRLSRLARQRRQLGVYGRRNNGRHVLFRRFGYGLHGLPTLLRGLLLWTGAELATLFHRLRKGKLRMTLPPADPLRVSEREKTA